MTSEQIKTRMQTLRDALDQAAHAYYNLDEPIMADHEYDALFQELLKLEKEHPELVPVATPTRSVGAKVTGGFKSERHALPMLSLDNAFTFQDVKDFHNRLAKILGTGDIHYCLEPKFDGLALELVYEDGILMKAITRGDGETGEVVSQNARTIRNIPFILPKTSEPVPKLIEIRGEVIIEKKQLEIANEDRIKNGKTPFTNARNAAAGSLRQLDPKECEKRGLKFYAYGVGRIESDYPLPYASQKQLIGYFSTLGFSTGLYMGNCLIDMIETQFGHATKSRELIPYDIDGMVIKSEALTHQATAGNTSHAPRWAIAWKFPAEQKTTKLRSIAIQVGRTGALTPVALLDPVQIAGVTVTKATLHNQDYIKSKDIRIGDTVIIQRAGDVIPEIVGILPAHRKETSVEFSFPSNCPECGSQAERIDGEAVTRCVNPGCPAQRFAALTHFVSKDAYDIEGLGPKLIEQLLESNIVKDYADFFRLTEIDLKKISRMGEKSIQNILSAIQKRRTIPFHRFLYGLGIPLLGHTVSKLLASRFQEVEDFLKATDLAQNFTQIDGVGEKIAQNIVTWFSSTKNLERFNGLLDAGVEIFYETPAAPSTAKLASKVFVITGTLSQPRQHFMKLIEDNGGKVAGSISAKTDFLLAGEKAGSKRAKAEKIGVPIIGEADFLELIAA
ncbi:MAG: NAD-dependent DNA ligase LigA [Candidatus Aminicenantes bacterium]|nr:NAD-dependent DNA ligase LigA [Candidatus Aminicenantes bacterium]